MESAERGEPSPVVQKRVSEDGTPLGLRRSLAEEFIPLPESSPGDVLFADEDTQFAGEEKKKTRKKKTELQPQFAQRKTERRDFEKLVPFDLQNSLAEPDIDLAAGPFANAGIVLERHLIDVTSDSSDGINGRGPAKPGGSESFMLPLANQELRRSVIAEQDAVFQQKSALLRQAGIVYSKIPDGPNSYVLQAQATSATSSPADVDSEASGGQQADDPEEYGIPPPRRIPLFLQESTVLLEVGEYQYESGVRYSTNANVFPVATILDGTAFVANATRKQQSIITPLEFRVGIGEELQAFVNLPLGWSKQRTTAQTTQQAEDNKVGIGDLSLGLTKLLWDWKADRTRLLGSVSVSAPTGPSAFAIDSQANSAVLGRGYWTAGGGLNLVHTIDPLAFFGGVGYTQTFPVNADGESTLDAGNTFYYSVGLGYAVNPSVSLNTSFSGGYTGELALNGVRLAGTATEPLSLRVAATFANIDRDNDKKKKPHHKYLTATLREPYVRFGLTGSATDVDFGIRVTY